MQSETVVINNFSNAQVLFFAFVQQSARSAAGSSCDMNMLLMWSFSFHRRLPLVIWLTQKCCRCCGVEPSCPQSANDSLNMSANGNTTYTTGAHSGLGTSCTVRSGSARTSRTSSGNHGTPYVMVTLRQDEKDLLVKHCSKSSTSGASSQLVASAELTSDSHISRV